MKICSELGSDSAYSCYGEFLHAFVAGWEYEEKAKAFNAIKGTFCFSHFKLSLVFEMFLFFK